MWIRILIRFKIRIRLTILIRLRIRIRLKILIRLRIRIYFIGGGFKVQSKRKIQKIC